MKILILALARTGSSSLFEAIKYSREIPFDFTKFEPENHSSFHNLSFNKIDNSIGKDFLFDYFQKLENNNDILIKSILNQTYNVCKALDINLNNYLDSLLKRFDQIILLTRRNKEDICHSHITAYKTYIWHQAYKFNPNLVSKDELKKQLLTVENLDNIMSELSYKYSLPIIYYEDLFTNDIQYLKHFIKRYRLDVNDFDIFSNILHPKNRYKQK